MRLRRGRWPHRTAGPQIDWKLVAQRVLRYVAAEDAAGRAGILAATVVRHMALAAITDGGVPAGLASVDAAPGEDGETFDLVIDVGAEVVVVSVGCHLEMSGSPKQLQNAATVLIASIRRTATAPVDQRVQVAVLSRAVFDRLRTLAPGIAGKPGDEVKIAFPSTRKLTPSGAGPYSIAGRLEAHVADERFTCLVLRLDKPAASG